jgi:ribonuclease HII
VTGLPDFQGTFSGFYDDATAQTYTAAVDGVARKFYFYTDIVNDPAQYFFGTAFVDFALDSDVAGALAISGNISAASVVAKVG